MLVRFGDYGLGLGGSLSAFDAFDRRFDQLFDGPARLAGRTNAAVHGAPHTEFHEDADALVIRADVPGFEREELRVSLEEDVLTLTGEQRPAEGEEARTQARPPRRFTRSFGLRFRVDAENVTATLRNGVLELRLPKAVESKSRQIEVRAA
ncbi:MAG: Hsp20/alpha crystallin family protein [Polyangiaceae bacterium]|nr:Hsp20/alpha crystallin family protein [Polyangiaceae bacterium]